MRPDMYECFIAETETETEKDYIWAIYILMPKLPALVEDKL